MVGVTYRFALTGLFALMTAAGSAGAASAQASLLGAGAAYLSGGVAGIDADELNERLDANGYPTFGTSAAVLGIGAYRLFSNGLMCGFEGNGLGVGEEESIRGDIGLGGGYATLGIGYAFALPHRMRVYPRIGIGAGGMGLSFESEEDTVDFDDVLANPQPAPDVDEPVLSIDGLVIDVGGGVEFTPMRRGSGPLISVRAGYLYAPFDDHWNVIRGSSSSDVTNGPDASISGFYVRVVVGGAWRR